MNKRDPGDCSGGRGREHSGIVVARSRRRFDAYPAMRL